jgi:ribosomal-protein-alanine N-acetyltransferase
MEADRVFGQYCLNVHIIHSIADNAKSQVKKEKMFGGILKNSTIGQNIAGSVAKPGCLIRRATAADLPAVMRIETVSYNIFTREAVEVYQERLAVFPEGFLVAEEGEVVGALSSEIWRGTDADSFHAEQFSLGHSAAGRLDREGEALYLSSIALSPAARGRGIGKRLFRALPEYLRGEFPRLRETVLLVNETWSAARRLYQSEGFTEAARFPGFFKGDDGTPQDGIVMRKILGISGGI